MGWIVWLIAGALSGAFVATVTRNRLGLLGDTVMGVVGAMIGGLLAVSVGAPGPIGLVTWSVLFAFVSALGLLAVLHTLGGNRRTA